MTTEVTLEIWVIRKLLYPYEITVHQGLKNFKPDHYLDTGDFAVSTVSAHLFMNNYKSSIDFSQHGQYKDSAFKYDQAIPMNSLGDESIHEIDKTAFFEEINARMHQYNLPLERLDSNSRRDFKIRQGND